MKDKLLTILIPTYNMEAYLERCLQSLIVSSEQMAQLEVLVINDGSKDRSLEIARGFEKKCPQTYRVIDKDNGNYGSCINRGLKEATGKYIKVLDADDWFNNADFCRFLAVLKTMDVDMILSAYSVVDAQSLQSNLAYQSQLQEGVVYDFQSQRMSSVGTYTMHAITYRTELLRNIGYLQTEGISYTDQEWVYKPMYAIKSVTYLNLNLYQYLIGREGQTMDSNVMVKTIDHHEKVVYSLIENAKVHPASGLSLECFVYATNYLLTKIYKTRLVLQSADTFNHSALMELDEYVKSNLPFQYKALGRLILKKAMPIPYVAYWRIWGKRFPVDGIRNLYRTIRYGK